MARVVAGSGRHEEQVEHVERVQVAHVEEEKRHTGAGVAHEEAVWWAAAGRHLFGGAAVPRLRPSVGAVGAGEMGASGLFSAKHHLNVLKTHNIISEYCISIFRYSTSAHQHWVYP